MNSFISSFVSKEIRSASVGLDEKLRFHDTDSCSGGMKWSSTGACIHGLDLKVIN